MWWGVSGSTHYLHKAPPPPSGGPSFQGQLSTQGEAAPVTDRTCSEPQAGASYIIARLHCECFRSLSLSFSPSLHLCSDRLCQTLLRILCLDSGGGGHPGVGAAQFLACEDVLLPCATSAQARLPTPVSRRHYGASVSFFF